MEKADRIKILYVDDEMNNLIGFKASFRTSYNIFIANDTTEAVSILEKHPDIRIIFCDQRMPDKTGSEFFEEIRISYPDAIRILITGYSDIESVIDAINKGNVFKYIKKPWLDDDIISSVNEANKFYIANQIIATKNAELKKAYDELDKFSYSITHDMRGPLLSVLGAVDEASSIDDINELKTMVGMMRDSIVGIDGYIQSLHDYYNVNRGELKISEIDFKNIVHEQLDTFKFTARMNNIRFKANVNQNETFRGDATSMRIILSNLLSNAFKYQKKDSPEKVVELDIKVETGEAVITVKDNGIGIAGSHIGDIFNMFFRATSEEIGSGFGLYNVKDALLKLNGEIKVDSVVDEGTTFKVVIRNK